MPTNSVNLSGDYATQLAQLQQRQKMAQMLQEQAVAPIDVQSYKGIQAPISNLSLLAKALQGFGGAYLSQNAFKDQAKLNQASAGANIQALKDADAAAEIAGNPQPPPASVIAPPPEPVSPPVNPNPVAEATSAINAPASPISVNPVAELPSSSPNAELPSSSPNAALAQALAGPPNAPPMGGPPPQASPPGIPPMGGAPQASPPNAPPMGGAPPQAPTTPQAPVAPPVAAAPTAVAPIANPYDKSVAMANARYQALVNVAVNTLSPTDQKTHTEMLNTASTQLSEARNKQTEYSSKEAEKETARVNDVNRSMVVVNGMIDRNEIPSELAPTALAIVNAQGSEGLKAFQTKIIDNTLGPHDVYLNPDEVKAAGFGPGSVIQRNTVTGEAKVLVDGTKVLQENRRINLEAQNAATNRDRFNYDKEQKQAAILPQDVIKQMAAQAWQGDKSVFQNLGKGTQGAQNIVNLRTEIAAQGQGRPPGDLARMNANFVGQTAEARAIGARSGNATFANAEMAPAVALSKESYAKLPRGAFVPLNQLRRLVDTNISSPEQNEAFVNDEDAIATYARALSPNGIARLQDIDKGRNLLSGVNSIKAHNATLDAMQRVVEKRQAAAHALFAPQVSKPSTYDPVIMSAADAALKKLGIPSNGSSR